MTDNEEKKELSEERSSNLKDKRDISKEKFTWKFCPNCGVKLPEIEKLKFCISCGLDLIYLHEHKTLNPTQVAYTYVPPQTYQPYPSPYMSYKQPIEKLSDQELLEKRDEKLWGSLASIGIPLLAFVAMNLLVIGIVVILVLITFDIDSLYNIITNPYFIVITSLVEFVLIIFPLWYAGKYLQRPSFKNRLNLLGFTSEGYDRKGVSKEVLLGLGFAVLGIFIVGIVALSMELFLEFIFGVDIIQSDGPSSDVEVIISTADIIILVLLILVMIFCVGPTEELLFRGFMQRGLVRNLGEKLGILITAFIFAIIHLLALFLVISDAFTLAIIFLLLFAPYFAISLMLGLIFKWRKENLITVIITHGVYNSLTVILAFSLYLPFEIFVIVFYAMILLMTSSFLLYYLLQKMS